MTEEDFIAWRENPVTRYVMLALSNIANENEALAKQHAWQAACDEWANDIDAHLLTVLAEKSKSYRSLVEATFENIQRYAEGEEE